MVLDANAPQRPITTMQRSVESRSPHGRLQRIPIHIIAPPHSASHGMHCGQEHGRRPSTLWESLTRRGMSLPYMESTLT
jgi:hypothetical protein